MALYLDRTATGMTVVYGMTTTADFVLLGGDANDDDTINIVDIGIIAVNFGTSGPAGDINADGTVNIVDIAGAAVNFGLSSS
jgi:hypothetical protein